MKDTFPSCVTTSLPAASPPFSTNTCKAQNVTLEASWRERD